MPTPPPEAPPSVPTPLFGRPLSTAWNIVFDTRAMHPRAFAGWLLLIMLLAWVLRMNWLLLGGWDVPAMNWQGTPLLTSVDGYFFGVGAQALLEGTDFGRLRVPGAHEYAVVALAWLTASVLPASLDQVMLYLPPILGALVAIPVALVARDVLGARPGLVATGIAMVAPGFALRTSAGFFDTDPFAIGVPILIVFFLLRLFDRRQPRWALAAALTLAVHTFFYDQGDPVGAVIATVAIAYLWFFHRRDPALSAWLGPITAALGLAVIELPWFVRAPIVLAVWLLMQRLPWPAIRHRHAGLVMGVAGLLLSLAWRSIAYKWFYYTGLAAEGPLEGSGATAGITFGDTTQYITEIRRADLGILSARLTGSLVTTLAGVAGMVLLALNRRSLLVALPIVAVGAFSMLGGSRFAMYLGVPLALGLAAGLWHVGGLVGRRWRLAGPFTAVVLALGIAGPAAALTWRSQPRVAITHDEVAMLDRLRAVITPGDTVISWWDYGYPISYFTRGRTIVDGSRRGDEAGIVAEIMLNSSQTAAANLARAVAEAAERLSGTDWSVAAEVFREAREDQRLEPAVWLARLGRPETAAARPTRRVFLYLPLRMVGALPAIQGLRPNFGTQRPAVHLAAWLRTVTDGTRLVLTPDTFVDAESVTLVERGQSRRLKGIIALKRNGDRIEATRVMRYPRAPTTGLFFDEAGIFVETDDTVIGSTWMQLFALDAPESRLFTPLFRNGAAAVFEVMR